MSLEKGKTYVRFSPREIDRTVVTIKTEQELRYHQDLQAGGYRYEENAAD